ncbi:MAG: aminopeptidase P family protein [Anaerolineaceae bacterium]|nr:aminopeptidase P family protein [Anaerolineaceae bacterium]
MRTSLTENWYRQKTKQIQNQMAIEQIDVLLLLDSYNIFYASGFFHQSTERPLGLMIPQNGESQFFVPLLEQEMAQDTWIKKVHTYFDYPGNPNAFSWILENMPEKNVAVDKLSYREWQMAQEVRPNIKVTDLVYTMRLVKDVEEIEILEAASIYADYLVERSKEAIIMGLSETDAFYFTRDRMFEKMKEEIGELTYVNQGLMNGVVLYGDHSAHPHGLLSDRLPKPGDVIQSGYGALVATYESESEHCFILGEPDKQTLSYFKAQYGAWEAGMQAARPGATCAEVNEAALNVIREAGYEKYLRHRMGHGKGLEEHEAPWIEAGDQTVLKPGMIISDEPGLYVPGLGGFRHSDTLVITEDGCRRLTNYPRDLENVVIPV